MKKIKRKNLLNHVERIFHPRNFHSLKSVRSSWSAKKLVHFLSLPGLIQVFSEGVAWKKKTCVFVTHQWEQVHSQSIFVAFSKRNEDGKKALLKALKKRPLAVIGSWHWNEIHPKWDLNRCPYFYVQEERQAFSWCMAHLKAHPSRVLKIVGVTGTSGKTTISTFATQLLEQAGFATIYIGTLGVYFQKKWFQSNWTTPPSEVIQHVLAAFLTQGAQVAVIEVSSHALSQYRIHDIAFDVFVFTNLTKEHLDYHRSFAQYRREKEKFFTDMVAYSQECGKKVQGIFLKKAPYSKHFQELFSKQVSKKNIWQVGASSIPLFGKVKVDFQNGALYGEKETWNVRFPLLGTFQRDNLFLAMTVAQVLKVPSQSVEKSLLKLKPISGRMECIWKNPFVWIDYAHKPHALEKVLQELRAQMSAQARLIVVLGCGGDRDRKKRSEMGSIAFEKSDLFIVTSDNPRSENPKQIAQEMISKIPIMRLKDGWRTEKKQNKILIELNRKKAIQKALEYARIEDWVLIAGKGHERFQEKIVGKKRIRIFFEDRKVALSFLSPS